MTERTNATQTAKSQGEQRAGGDGKNVGAAERMMEPWRAADMRQGKEDASAGASGAGSKAPTSAAQGAQPGATQGAGGAAASNGTNVGQYVLSKTIGKGTFGSVSLVKHLPTGK